MLEGLSETPQEFQISNKSEIELSSPTFNAVVQNGSTNHFPEVEYTSNNLKAFENFLKENTLKPSIEWSYLKCSLNIFGPLNNEICLEIEPENWHAIIVNTNQRDEKFAGLVSLGFTNLSYDLVAEENPSWLDMGIIPAKRPFYQKQFYYQKIYHEISKLISLEKYPS